VIKTDSSVFVISEFNPFHFGHKYLIDTLKRDFSTVICVMSGNSVQRGEVACAEKYQRAAIAVNSGANLVLELCFPFSSLSAKDFAAAGVFAAGAFGCQTLAFGAEDDKETVTRAAEVLFDRQKIKEYIKLNPNLSYPKAAKAILKESLGAGEELIEKPNNILAVEYISAIKALGLSINTLFVKREKGCLSSSAVRRRLSANFNEGLSLLPGTTSEPLGQSGLWNGKALDAAFISKFRLSGGEGDCYGIDAGGFKSVYNSSMSSRTLDEVCEKAASTILTRARVRRALLLYFFGVGREYGRKTPSYSLLLAADKIGREYISKNKKSFGLPLITKPADYKKAGKRAETDFLLSADADIVFGLASPNGVYNPLLMTPYMP